MAPVSLPKRNRAFSIEEGSELNDVESATSNFRRDSRKRQRLSSVTGHGEYAGAVSDGSDGRDDRDVSDESGTITGSESDEGRNEEDNDRISDDEVDARTAQIIVQRYQEIKENQPADNGIIEEVVCTNFMCHSKLSVKFGPLINFIIGHNGSGKSAVLTALTLCLGGKATATNRGQSLKSFIKEGQESATLSVRVKNRGSSAYKPELYGKSIIVERHFSVSGASGFKIKNADGRIVSTKRADLEDISDFFALQLDNPMNVLTQDMARQFLNNSTPGDKYKFFIKGTQLEQLDNDYRLMEESLDMIEPRLEAQNEGVQSLKRRYKDLQKKVELADRHQNILDRIRDYGRQMAWAQVIEQERYLEQMELDTSQAEEKIARVTEDAEAAAVILDEAERAHEQAQLAVEELRTAVTPFEEIRAKLRAKFDENKDQLISVQADQRNIREALYAAKSNTRRIEKDIEEERQRLAGANGGQHAQKLDDIENARVQAQEAELEHERHGSMLEQLQRDLTEAQRELDRAKPAVERKREEVRKCEQIIQNMTKDAGNWKLAYEPNLDNLMRAIEHERGFRERPVGPVGRYIRLLKPEWASIVERSLGGTLNAFVVTSKEDQNLLLGLMRRTNCKPQILVGSARPLDTTSKEPDPGLMTVLRILKIDSDLVRNQLIINHAVEQSVLIENREEAMSFMYDGDRPNNTKQCFCFVQKRGSGLRLGFTPSGAESTTPMRPWDGRPRLQTDRESQLNMHKENLQQLKREHADADTTLREKAVNVNRCSQAINRHGREQRDLLIKKQRAEELVERLRDELEAETPQDGKLEALQSQLQEAEQESGMLANSFQDSVDAKDALNDAQRVLKRQMDENQMDLDEANAKVNKGEQKLHKLADKRHTALLQKNKAYELIEDAKADKAEQVRKRDKQAQVVQGFIQQASEVSERVPVDPNETAASLDKKLDRLHKDMENQQRELGGSREDINMQMLEAKQNFERGKAQHYYMQKTAQGLKQAMQNRRIRWQQFRRLISQRAKTNFTYLLSERDFRGKLITNHETKELDMTVEPDITKSSARGRQTKTLSGGEKSFATICLLLSLWEAMGSPIRCLDEFDVFMDNVNRDVSMKMMIGAARRSVSRQFVLITPQAMGNVSFGDDVKIIKMRDPERGQTALPFA